MFKTEDIEWLWLGFKHSTVVFYFKAKPFIVVRHKFIDKLNYVFNPQNNNRAEYLTLKSVAILLLQFFKGYLTKTRRKSKSTVHNN